MFDLSRRKLVLASSAAALLQGKVSAQTPLATPPSTSISTCGVNYDLGAELFPGVMNRSSEHQQYFRGELETIRHDLHCESVSLFGSDTDLLATGLDIAADLGFDIKYQSRLNFLDEPEMLDRLAVVAQDAERVRLQGVPIVLDVGCEYLLFANGLIEGADIFEKLDTIDSTEIDWVDVITRMDGLLRNLAQTARKHFAGAITYSDTPDMDFAWDAFDIVGIDHYLSAESAPTYSRVIQDLTNLEKPIWINEFGACPWEGSLEAGGMGWDIFDYSVDPPVLQEGIVRSEQDQADGIQKTLDLVNQSPAERAYLYHFIEPLSPRSHDPQRDLDLAAYSIVSCWGSEHDQPYESTGYTEPKLAFNELAERNAALIDN